MRQLLRALTTMIALIASGLAVVAVGPAPPAAAYPLSLDQVELDPRFPFGQSKICVAGGVQTPSSWFRRYRFGGAVGELQGFSVRSVRFGVDTVALPPGKSSLSVKIRVYNYPAGEPLTWEKLRQAPFAEATATVPGGTWGQVLKVDHDFGSFSRSEEAVVEVYYPGGVKNEAFWIGSTIGPETEYGFFSYPGCPAALADRQPPWGQIQPIAPVWNTMKVYIGLDGEVVQDRDNDGLPDAVDDCPAYAGPRGGAHPGCQIIGQVITVSYDPERDHVSGTVSIEVPAGSGIDVQPCSDPVLVKLYTQSGDMLGSTWTSAGTTKTFGLGTAHVADGTRAYVVAEAFFDRTPSGSAGIAVCTESNAAPVTIQGRGDYDLDGVPNDGTDACPGVPGPEDSVLSGCPRIEQKVSASYENGASLGQGQCGAAELRAGLGLRGEVSGRARPSRHQGRPGHDVDRGRRHVHVAGRGGRGRHQAPGARCRVPSPGDSALPGRLERGRRGGPGCGWRWSPRQRRRV